MLKKISELEANTEEYLNEDNHYGTFYLEDLNKMAKFGLVPETIYEIHIEGGEGFIPHIHLCKKSGKNIILRICLLKNEYFREKDDRKNVLDTSERKALDNYLNDVYSNYKNGITITNWEALCMMWNNLNPAHKIDLNKYQKPNYVNILEPK